MLRRESQAKRGVNEVLQCWDENCLDILHLHTCLEMTGAESRGSWGREGREALDCIQDVQGEGAGREVDSTRKHLIAVKHDCAIVKQEKLEQAKLKAEYRRLAKQAEKMTMVGVEIK